MEEFITALGAGVTPAVLWGALADAVPFIITVVVVAFGYRIVRRLVSGVSKGKAKF